jgi:hypothetical protein
MHVIMKIIFLMTLISLTGCQHMKGNVVPQQGPTMEAVYDSMEVKSAKIKIPSAHLAPPTKINYKKIPNPELKMYIYPHLVGKEELPVTGYYTAFSAYTRDHYVLPS